MTRAEDASTIPQAAGWRRRVLATLAEAVLPPDPAGAARPGEAAAAAAFLEGQQDALPHLLKPAMRAATLLFDLSALPRGLRPFHRLPLAARRRHLAAWRRAPVGAFRDFVKFHESFAVFHVHHARRAGEEG